jgi:hypothetical protein
MAGAERHEAAMLPISGSGPPVPARNEQQES